MADDPLGSTFGALLRDLVDWLEDTRVQGVVIGGLAASLLGRPRLTRDVDLLVLLDAGRWIREFSAALDRPEILDDFQALVRQRFTKQGS